MVYSCIQRCFGGKRSLWKTFWNQWKEGGS